MNILLVSYYNPLGKGGFEQQTTGLFEYLRDRGNQIGCLTVSSLEHVESTKDILDSSKIFNLGNWVLPYQEYSYSSKAKISFFFTKNSAQFLSKLNQSLCDLILKSIEEITSQYEIDVVHVLGLKTSYLISSIDSITVPVVIDLLDSFTIHKKRKITYNFQNQSNHLLSDLIEYFKTLKIEKSILSTYAKKSPIVAISNSDAEVFKKLCPEAKVYVVPAGLSHGQIQEKPGETLSKEKLLTFHGFMNQIHNLDTLQFLIYQIIPLVHKEHPDLRLAITGLYLSDEIFLLADQFNWIEVFPFVENINEFILQATVTCWPFRCGSGVKTKIIESMALGKAVVTTTIGSEALTESQKQGLLIADNAKDLAHHISYLLSNSEECIRLGSVNQQIATTEFTWENRAKRYTDIYESVIHQTSKMSTLSKPSK